MMSERAKKALLEWTPVSKRMIKARFYSRYKKMTVIQVYAPTNEAADEEKEDFYNQLQDVIADCNKHDLIVVMGDFNAKVGEDNTSREEVIGRHGVGIINDNGERLCDICSTNGFIVTGTIFPHKEIHKTTWKSPDGRTLNQIDHVLVNGNMRTSVLDTRVMRGADVFSDHFLVRTKIRLKLMKNKVKNNTIERFDVKKLNSDEIRRRFNAEVRNRFQVLQDVQDVEEEYDKILEVYREAAKDTIGNTKKQSKPWIK